VSFHAINSIAAGILVAFGFQFPGCLFDTENESDVHIWASVAPIQCGGNAWEQQGKSIEDYLSDRDVEVIELKTTTFADAVCLACSCINGQRVDILISEEDLPKVLSEGFVRAEDWPY
jgi:hypothetical protein